VDPVEVFAGEAGDKGGVLECLHLDGVGSLIALQLDHDEATIGVEGQNVQAVSLPLAGVASPGPGGDVFPQSSFHSFWLLIL
jgi:hypothetical protein